MKNIFLLPTDKPSKLYFFKDVLEYDSSCIRTAIGDIIKQHIYITSDEEIKDEDWYLDTFNNVVMKANKFSDHKHYRSECKKIILTTDQKLIDEGIQGIDDKFLEWFAWNPKCEKVEVRSQMVIDYSFPRSVYYKHEIITPKETPEEHVELINKNIEKFDKALEEFDKVKISKKSV